jgi:acetate kinase
MPRIILSVNAGSSSVKVSVYQDEGQGGDPKELAVVQVDGLTAPPATLKYTRGEQNIKGKEIEGISSQEDGFRYIMEHLEKDDGLPELSRREDITFVTHRVVHGGDYPRAQVINKETYHHIEILSDLAPLHNAGALTIVQAAHKELPKATNIAYFDSAYHSSIPKHISTYPIDQEIAKKNQLRKYGFHGISYSFIIKAVAKYLQKPVDQTSIIALHLGSGASACAIKGGKSWDTSMGLTPLAGLPGATRSGSVDPSLVFHYTHEAGKMSTAGTKELHITMAEQILNKESGWKAIAGTTDFGKISAGEDEGSKLAFDLFVDRILGFVGSYYVTLRGEVDALVFAGGIGEKGVKLRAKVVEGASCLGFAVDEKANAEPEDEVVTEVTGSGAKHKVLICQTDEQLEMARNCVEEAETFMKEVKDSQVPVS